MRVRVGATARVFANPTPSLTPNPTPNRATFQDKKLVNWCPKLGTVLANEEIIDGVSERGNFPRP